MARSVPPRRRAPASEVTRPPSNSATSSRPPALPNPIPVALHCVGIGEHPPSGLNSFSQNKFYPFRDPDAPQPMRDAGLTKNFKRKPEVGSKEAMGTVKFPVRTHMNGYDDTFLVQTCLWVTIVTPGKITEFVQVPVFIDAFN